MCFFTLQVWNNSHAILAEYDTYLSRFLARLAGDLR